MAGDGHAKFKNETGRAGESKSGLRNSSALALLSSRPPAYSTSNMARRDHGSSVLICATLFAMTRDWEIGWRVISAGQFFSLTDLKKHVKQGLIQGNQTHATAVKCQFLERCGRNNNWPQDLFSTTGSKFSTLNPINA